MTWDPVPYMIGGGARHSEEVFRQMAFVALGGNEGVLGPNDLKVTALTTPAGSVNVNVGGAAMLGRGASQFEEMYTGRMPTIDTVPIAATGAGTGRSDLVIGRIEDPNIAGSQWSAPAVVADGPYVFTRVLSGVPATTTSVLDLDLDFTAVTLARVDVPVSTSSITQAMIVDLRKIANPRRDRRMYTVNPDTSSNIQLKSASLADWFGTWTVDIPYWATRVVMSLIIGGVWHSRLSSGTNGTANGEVRAALGTLYTQTAKYDVETTQNNNVARYMIGAADTVKIPAAVRGTTQTLRIQGDKLGGNVPVAATNSTFASIDVEFQESAA